MTCRGIQAHTQLGWGPETGSGCEPVQSVQLAGVMHAEQLVRAAARHCPTAPFAHLNSRSTPPALPPLAPSCCTPCWCWPPPPVWWRLRPCSAACSAYYDRWGQLSLQGCGGSNRSGGTGRSRLRTKQHGSNCTGLSSCSTRQQLRPRRGATSRITCGFELPLPRDCSPLRRPPFLAPSRPCASSTPGAPRRGRRRRWEAPMEGRGNAGTRKGRVERAQGHVWDTLLPTGEPWQQHRAPSTHARLAL